MAAKLVNNVLGISSYAMLLEAMQLAAAYGMDEDVVTSLVTQGWGDSRHARAWGRQDRRRRELRHRAFGTQRRARNDGIFECD